MKINQKKNFLLYDFMQVTGGAERVTLTMARELGDFETYVSRCYREAQPLIDEFNLEVNELCGKLTKIFPRIIESIFCFVFLSGFLKNAHCVIYSGFYSPLAVFRQKRGRKIYYCHTIPRFAYDLYDEYLDKFPFLIKPFYKLFVFFYRYIYSSSISRMDLILVNSYNIKLRLLRYTGLDAEVLYPPVSTQNFKYMGDEGYYLSTARLVKNKRVDVIIKAFLKMPDKNLVVLSGGDELPRLMALAEGANNIKFTGWQSDSDLKKWLGNAKAIIYIPVDEDFGMSPVEAMAAGKPVIGVAQGGLLETIVDGVTGMLLENPPTPDSLMDAVELMEKWNAIDVKEQCELRAHIFAENKFIENLKNILR